MKLFVKPLLRIFLASLVGFLAGRAVLWVWPAPVVPSPHPPAAEGTLTSRQLPPGSGKEEEWRLWLQAHTGQVPVRSAEEFWKDFPASGTVPEVEWNLALDAAFLTLPDAEFLKLIQDPRFGKFPPLYEAEQNAVWSRKLLAMGLDQALALAGKMPTQWLNVHLDHLLTVELAKKDPERGLEWFRASGKDDWETRDFIETVAKNDPAKAMELVSKMTPEATRKYCAGALLKGLAEKDWRAAVEFGRANFSAEEWPKESSHMFDGIYGSRLGGLFEMAAEITDPDARSAAYSQGIFSYSKTGDMVLAKALELPAGTFNKEGWYQVAWLCAAHAEDSEVSPAAAAAKLREQAQKVPETERASFWEGVIRTACWNYPTIATHFYDELPLEKVGKMVTSWVGEDPAAASAWLATLGDSERREAAVAAFCRETEAVDPAGAAVWAAGLKDAAVRDERLRGALSAWSQVDGAQARAWAEAKGVPNLLAPLEPVGAAVVDGKR